MKKYNGEDRKSTPLDKNHFRLENYWRRAMDSTQKVMSRGAQNVDKIITWARQDNWRRPHNRPKKK